MRRAGIGRPNRSHRSATVRAISAARVETVGSEASPGTDRRADDLAGYVDGSIEGDVEEGALSVEAFEEHRAVVWR